MRNASELVERMVVEHAAVLVPAVAQGQVAWCVGMSGIMAFVTAAAE